MSVPTEPKERVGVPRSVHRGTPPRPTAARRTGTHGACAPSHPPAAAHSNTPLSAAGARARAVRWRGHAERGIREGAKIWKVRGPGAGSAGAKAALPARQGSPRRRPCRSGGKAGPRARPARWTP
eukprot:gene23821-biopygen22339